jgi:rifampicin phosphotransferase
MTDSGMTSATATDVTFEAPGAGEWQLDRSHFEGGTTPVMQWVIQESTWHGFLKLFKLFGIPAETMSIQFVNGFSYSRLRPLFGADKAGAKPPPTPILKLVSRLHPEMRRRNKSAKANLANPPWAEAMRDWEERIRPEMEAKNLALQDVDLVGLSDIELAGQLDELLRHLRWTYEEHFRLHGYDLGPLGIFVVAGQDWGLDSARVVSALVGASPSTAAPVRALEQIATGLRELGVEATSLEQVALASPEIAEQLAAYMRANGAKLYAGYDLDRPTLGESPETVLGTIRAAVTLTPSEDAAVHAASAAQIASELRAEVPEGERARFDELLAAAREAMDLRDDNGPMMVAWPQGLLRLGMLEAGRRLGASGRIAAAEHVMELEHDELAELVRSGSGPSADELTARAEERRAQKQLDPPQRLGASEAPPPLAALPSAMASLVRMVMTINVEVGLMEPEPGAWEAAPELVGTGIGAESYRGRARTATDAEEAIAKLEPGEILVTRTTTPAYNMVLALVGGLVTEEGGPMSHAAVLSRELRIPAVIGARGALGAISDGDEIEVDPSSGEVRVLSKAATSEVAGVGAE